MKINLFYNLAIIFQGTFLISIAWWGYSYYTGKIRFTGVAEEHRKNKVKKYSQLFIIMIIGCLCSGIYLIVDTLWLLAISSD